MTDTLINISPIDGRYNKYTKPLADYFSEYGLFRYRVFVELEYFLKLIDILNIKIENGKELKLIHDNFNINECKIIKQHESTINHDVKAVEYYLKDKFTELNVPYTNLIHFGLTSQDINNTALTLSIKDYIEVSYIPNINKILNITEKLHNKWNTAVMISRTHGQPAVPTSMGKEIKVFNYRLQQQLELMVNLKYYGKFGGASGNLNAHYFAYPDINWDKFGDNFLKNIGLIRSKYTTQIDNYDSISNIFDCIKRKCVILVDMCRDIWHYISINYLVQSINKNEVGSSTMPHKVNPINFENAEGNLLIAISLLEFMSRKLPVSRLQRDLTDSTVTRNIGVIFGHIEIAYQNIFIGLSKLDVNKETIELDLNENIVVITEGIQTYLRRIGDNNAYEKVKDFSRSNQKITIEKINEFIKSLNLNELDTNNLLNLKIKNYTGNVELNNN